MTTAKIIPIRTPSFDHRGECQRISELLDRELRAEGVAVSFGLDPQIGPTMYIIPVVCKGTVSKLDQAAQSVLHRMDGLHGLRMEYTKSGNRRQFVVQRAQVDQVYLTDLLSRDTDWLAQKPGRAVLGVQPNGSLLRVDLTDALCPHLLIGGQSGSGKSVLIQSIVRSLVAFHEPSKIRVHLCDPKRVTFTSPKFLAQIQEYVEGSVKHEAEEILPVLRQLVRVMEARYGSFAQVGAHDLDSFAQRTGRVLARHVVVVDEFQDLATDRRLSGEFFELVARLGSKARAAGVHLILATQRPDRNTLPPAIRANMTGRICLRVSSAVNSRIVLDQQGGEKLFGRGDMLASLGSDVVRAQAAL